MSNDDLALHLFLQVALILAACYVVGLGTRRLGQPQVVGDMVAGILLGPSLLGMALPGLQHLIFPPASLSVIYVLGQVGVALYMFIAGTHFRLDLMRGSMRSATSISIAGILPPFLLGVTLGYYLFQNHQFFSGRMSLAEAMIFGGAALSITAFPTLARIIQEQGLTATRLGSICLAAGCFNDAIAWCALSLVLATFTGKPLAAAVTVGGGAVYVAAMIGLGAPLLRRLGAEAERRESVGPGMLSAMLVLLTIAAWVTDGLGVHAIFGAFVLGAVMPRGIIVRELQRTLEPITLTFLLPLFFVSSGLNTRIGLVNTPELLAIMALTVVLACSGKGVACWAAARLSGLGQRDAITIGALMNTRGLMELVLLNTALTRGLITPALFTIFAIMAVITTFSASPIVHYVIRGQWAFPAGSEYGSTALAAQEQTG